MIEALTTTFSANLKNARKRAGLSQAALGSKMGLKGSAIARYELDEATPKPDIILQFAYVLGVTPNDLLGYQPTEHEIMSRDLSIMMLYAVRYALLSNGVDVAPSVINFVKQTLPCLDDRILYNLEKDVLFNYDGNRNIGATTFYDKEWTDFVLEVRKEREKRRSKE